jgi:hypothetical protein
MAVQEASPINSPDPAAAAAGASVAKIPALIIDPSPITTASVRPSRRRNHRRRPVTASRYRGHTTDNHRRADRLKECTPIQPHRPRTPSNAFRNPMSCHDIGCFRSCTASATTSS